MSMGAKVWFILLAALILAVAIYLVALIVASPRAEAPASGTTTSTFRGPVGLPYVKGPPGPPPGY